MSVGASVRGLDERSIEFWALPMKAAPSAKR
jgi:hypothetical protein